MTGKFFIIFLIIISAVSLILYPAGLLPYIQISFVMTWVILYHKFDQKRVLAYLIGFLVFFEFMTFLPIGIFGLSFFISLGLIEILKKILFFLRTNDNISYYLFGLSCSTIIFFFLMFIIDPTNVRLIYVISSLFLNNLLFVFSSVFIKRERKTGYVT